MKHLLIPYEPGFDIMPDTLGPSWLVDPSDAKVYLRCECGLILGGLKNHSIDAYGTVNASVLHNSDDKRFNRVCTWHEHVKLDQWAAGAQVVGVEKTAPDKVQR